MAGILPITFPNDLDEIQTIAFQAYKSPEFTQNLKNFEEATLNTPLVDGILIQLPLPANLEDSLNHTWNINHGAGAGQLASAGASAIRDLAGNFSSTLGTAIDKGSEHAGAHFDPNYFYSYVETQPRSFSYSINIIPKNQKESKSIADIVKRFKKYSSPTHNGIMVANFVWGMTLHNKILSDSLKLKKKRWALTSVGTNYTGTGSSLFFEDGYPKQINLSLTFQEITTMYSDDWD